MKDLRQCLNWANQANGILMMMIHYSVAMFLTNVFVGIHFAKLIHVASSYLAFAQYPSWRRGSSVAVFEIRKRITRLAMSRYHKKDDTNSPLLKFKSPFLDDDTRPRKMCLIPSFCFRASSYIVVMIVATLIFLLHISPNRVKLMEKDEDTDGLVITDRTVRLTQKLNVSHAYLVSVYYYPTSKSLGPNAVAFNMAIDHKSHSLEEFKFNVIGTNSTSRQTSVTVSQAEGQPHCRYALVASFTNTVSNLQTLEIEENGVTAVIPFKHARTTAPAPVIICISPQFVAEQWQMFLMHIHAAHRFGGHMHLYITSAVMPYFQMMKEYENQGYLTLDYWLRMKFENISTPYFDPNQNVEWRNQAGAQTDCLLQYKEAAEYIAFFDMDDILFPKNYPTYVQEFNNEFLAKPDAVSIFYGRREHEFLKDDYLNEFSFYELFASLKSSPTVKRGKVVVKPAGYNSTWIHYSMNSPWTLRINVTSPALVHVQRPIQKNGGNNYTSLWKIDFGNLIEKINREDIDHFQRDLERIRNISSITHLAPKLPSKNFYLPIVFKCYFDAFYGPAFVTKTGVHDCPNADICELPQRDDYKCMHSDAEYHSGPHMEPITFHWSTNSHWSEDIGCYQ